MRRALIVVDVQNDFCEGGALAVAGGAAVAGKITDFLESVFDNDVEIYSDIIATRDWHNPLPDTNAGHFDRWPVHCVAGSDGAQFHDNFDDSYVDYFIYKGQGREDYSGFDGSTFMGDISLDELLNNLDVTHVDVVGLATDHCVLATARDAATLGYDVRVIVDLTAGVAEDTTAAALDEMAEFATLIISEEIDG